VGHRRGTFALPRASFLLRAAVLAWRAPDLVFTRDLQLADALLRFPGGLAARVIYEAHAVEAILYGERGALYGTAERPRASKAARLARREARVWRRAGGFVATTAGILSSFSSMHGPRAHARVVPNGCDVPEGRRFPGLSEETPARVVYAGQLYPWKGVDVLVEAMREIPDARLVILGGLDGEADLPRVRERVQAAGLSSRTEMPGTVPQARVADELARAAVVVVPFLRSGMTERHTSPIKAFEAMAAGRPLVASDLPSSREFLRDGENALLVPPGEPPLLAQALRRILSDRGLAHRLACTAFAEAGAFSWDARAQHLRELFEEIAC
jgi:glycosyltransferase involved in cell wall biosynthesis